MMRFFDMVISFYLVSSGRSAEPIPWVFYLTSFSKINTIKSIIQFLKIRVNEVKQMDLESPGWLIFWTVLLIVLLLNTFGVIDTYSPWLKEFMG